MIADDAAMPLRCGVMKWDTTLPFYLLVYLYISKVGSLSLFFLDQLKQCIKKIRVCSPDLDPGSEHWACVFIPLINDATAQRTTMQLAILGEKKLRYFEMRCEDSEDVCNGDPFNKMNKSGSFQSYEPHENVKLKSILPNSKIDLVQLIEFSMLTKDKKKEGEVHEEVDEEEKKKKEPTLMQKILHQLSVF